MRRDPHINFNQDWKMVTKFVILHIISKYQTKFDTLNSKICHVIVKKVYCIVADIGDHNYP